MLFEWRYMTLAEARNRHDITQKPTPHHRMHSPFDDIFRQMEKGRAETRERATEDRPQLLLNRGGGNFVRRRRNFRHHPQKCVQVRLAAGATGDAEDSFEAAEFAELEDDP